METIAYTVSVTFRDTHTAKEWVQWLRAGHIAEVIAGGATDAEIIALEGGLEYEVRYHFPSREAFGVYEKDHAPRLRAEAVRIFPSDSGVHYRRTLGVQVATLQIEPRA